MFLRQNRTDYPQKAFVYPPGAGWITFVKDACTFLGLEGVDPIT